MRRTTALSIACAALSLLGGGSYAFLTNVLMATPCNNVCDPVDTTFRKPWFASFVVIFSNAITNAFGLVALSAISMLLRRRLPEKPVDELTDRADGVHFASGVTPPDEGRDALLVWGHV
jgi:hypothetical protein